MNVVRHPYAVINNSGATESLKFSVCPFYKFTDDEAYGVQQSA